MANRYLTPLGVAVIVATIALLIPVHAAAQGGSGSRDDRTASRTPWGDPDLQGVWTTDWERSVPFERPDEFGERAELTAEEIATRAEAETTSLADNKETRPQRTGSTEAGPEHWYEFGKEVSSRTSLVVEPPDGRIPSLTLGAQARQIDPTTRLGFVGGSMTDGPYDGPEDLHLADRCITRGYPQTLAPSAYNNGFQIVQSPGYVAILYERLHEYRIIPLDGRPQLTPAVRHIFGDSRGYWDGDTLVVEVTNFSDKTTYSGPLLSLDPENYRGSGSTLRLVERYSRVDDDTVRIEVTIDDPTTWTKPWTFAVNGIHDPNYWQVFEYACHEGNYGMTNILSAARNLEKAAAEGSR